VLARILVDLAAFGGAAVETIDTSDCERVRSTFPTQPVNTWSSFAYVVTGVWVWLRFARPGTGSTGPASSWLALGLVATGAGSVAYHGVGTDAARWLHDGSFLGLLLLVVVQDWPPRPAWSAPRPRAAAVGVVALAVAAVLPALTNAALLVLVGLLGWAEARTWATRPSAVRARLGIVAAVGIAALVTYLLGRTGGLLCDPEAVPQGHGLWHVLSAVAFGLWARATYPLAQASAAATAPGPTVS
jgi:hypothetical protein